MNFGMYKVYLAGPITGLDYEGATSWRDYAKERLGNLSLDSMSSDYGVDTGIEGYSPMRAKDYLLDKGVLQGHPDAYNDYILSSAKGILARDHWDVQTADLILVNFMGATQVSIGTVMEIAFAHAYRKPVVVAMEDDNIHHHAMLDQAVGWIAPDLDYAIEIAKAILLPDGVKVPA